MNGKNQPNAKRMRKKIICLAVIFYISFYLSGISSDFLFVNAIETDAERQCFDALYYANNNPDVVAVFGLSQERLFAHYMEYGRNEGRNASEAFNLQAYQERYEDLVSVFGDNLSAYPAHYLEYGIEEGRIATWETAEPEDEDEENEDEDEENAYPVYVLVDGEIVERQTEYQDEWDDDYFFLLDYLNEYKSEYDSDYDLFGNEDAHLYPARESSEQWILRKSDVSSSIEMITYDLTPISVALADWGEAYYYVYTNYASSRMLPGFRLMDIDFDGVPEFFIISDALNPFIFSFINGEIIGTAMRYRENDAGYVLDRSKPFAGCRDKSTGRMFWLAESSGSYREMGSGNYIKNYALDMVDFDRLNARTIMEWELVVISTSNKATGHTEYIHTYIVKEDGRRLKMSAAEFDIYKEEALLDYEQLKTPNLIANKWNFTDNDEIVSASFSKIFNEYVKMLR